jgi:acyl-CoA hydrolase
VRRTRVQERLFPLRIRRVNPDRLDTEGLDPGQRRLEITDDKVEAVLQSAAARRDLGVRAGMVGDTILEMMRDGVITNARKGSDRGLAVAGSAGSFSVVSSWTSR